MCKNRETSKARSHVSNPELVAMKRHPKREMRDQGSPWFPTTFRQARLRSETVQEAEYGLEAPLKSDIEGSLFKPSTAQAPAFAVNQLISNPLMATELKIAMRETTIE